MTNSQEIETKLIQVRQNIRYCRNKIKALTDNIENLQVKEMALLDELEAIEKLKRDESAPHFEITVFRLVPARSNPSDECIPKPPGL